MGGRKKIYIVENVKYIPREGVIIKKIIKITLGSVRNLRETIQLYEF